MYIIAVYGTLLVSQHPTLNHNILEPTAGVTLLNSGFKSDPTKKIPSKVHHSPYIVWIDY
jgi:hypothetical protein